MFVVSRAILGALLGGGKISTRSQIKIFYIEIYTYYNVAIIVNVNLNLPTFTLDDNNRQFLLR